MAVLITLLISLLGYGIPEDYHNHTEAELKYEINLAQEAQSDGGFNDWETNLDGE